MKSRDLLYVKIVFLIFAAAVQMLKYKNDLPLVYICALLLYLSICGLKQYFKQDFIKTILILSELICVFTVQSYYHGIFYMISYVVLFEIIIFEKAQYKYFMCVLSGVMLAILMRTQNSEIFIANFLLYILILFLGIKYKKIHDENKKIEYLYDDVRRYSYRIEESKHRLEQYSKDVEEIAQIKERNRISEEIHDTIGHRLTALLLQLEAALKLLDKDKDKGIKFLISSKEYLNESIEIMRKTVRREKYEGLLNIRSSLQQLINDFKRNNDVSITFNVKGEIIGTSPSVQIVLYKNCREALTNSLRHGEAKNISITLEYTKCNVILTVSNDGHDCKVVKKGMGLSSMEERLKLVNGTLEIESKDGFILKNSIPLN